ncbi:MAG: helix-turn-helix domain-containing protein [Psychrobium sp.]
MSQEKLVFDWKEPSNGVLAILGDDYQSATTQSIEDGAYKYILPPSLGDGYIELFHFDEHISMLVFNCKWKRSRSLYVDEGNKIRFNFSLELDMKMDLGEQQPLDLSEASWRVINHESCSLVKENILADTQTVWVTIAIDRDYLNQIFNRPTDSETLFITESLEKQDGKLIYLEYPLDHNLNRIVSNIISMNVLDSLRVSYAKSKATELLCEALDRIMTPQAVNDLPIKLRQCDEEAIKVAQGIIINNLSNVPSTREICMMIGMNRNKFYYGFKHLYKVSLNKYIKLERLAAAYRLLTETDKSIIEIASEVGFNHQSSLSTAFKAHYGVSPMQLRKNGPT